MEFENKPNYFQRGPLRRASRKYNFHPSIKVNMHAQMNVFYRFSIKVILLFGLHYYIF